MNKNENEIEQIGDSFVDDINRAVETHGDKTTLEDLSESEFISLKDMGLLWELYPKAPEFFKDITSEEFFMDLSSKQKRLDPDAQKLLNENFWDLV